MGLEERGVGGGGGGWGVLARGELELETRELL